MPLIKSSKNLGVMFAMIGVVMFSAKAVMVKLAYEFGIDSVSLLMLRLIFALPVYAVITFFQYRKSMVKVTKSDYLWIVLFGFVGYYLASIFDFIGLMYIKAGLERVILFVYPTIVLFISAIFLKKKIKRIMATKMNIEQNWKNYTNME